jgi:exodeoxyribonuclease-3
MAPFAVMTVNVNGVRAAARKGGIAWVGEQLRSGAVDVVCIQEVRATGDQLSQVLDEQGLADLHWAHDDSTRLGHSGVALISALPMRDVRTGVGPTKFEGTGRWVQATVDSPAGPVTVASVYVFAGDVDKPVQQDKYAFLQSMTEWFTAGRKRAKAGKGHFIVSGDFNVAHTEADIKNWRGNVGKAGFHVDERAYLDTWFDEVGVVDIGRTFAGQVEGPYTWWSMRGQAFDTDTGWRIDYHVTNPELAQHVTDVRIDKAATYAQRWSDHAPLTVTFDL